MKRSKISIWEKELPDWFSYVILTLCFCICYWYIGFNFTLFYILSVIIVKLCNILFELKQKIEGKK